MPIEMLPLHNAIKYALEIWIPKLMNLKCTGYMNAHMQWKSSSIVSGLCCVASTATNAVSAAAAAAAEQSWCCSFHMYVCCVHTNAIHHFNTATAIARLVTYCALFSTISTDENRVGIYRQNRNHRKFYQRKNSHLILRRNVIHTRLQRRRKKTANSHRINEEEKKISTFICFIQANAIYDFITNGKLIDDERTHSISEIERDVVFCCALLRFDVARGHSWLIELTLYPNGFAPYKCIRHIDCVLPIRF